MTNVTCILVGVMIALTITPVHIGSSIWGKHFVYPVQLYNFNIYGCSGLIHDRL